MHRSCPRVCWIIALVFLLLPLGAAAQDKSDPLKYFAGHSAPIHSAVYAPNGKTIATGSFDSTIKIWDRVTGEVVHTITEFKQPVLSGDISRSGLQLVGSGSDGIVKLFDLPPA